MMVQDKIAFFVLLLFFHTNTGEKIRNNAGNKQNEVDRGVYSPYKVESKTSRKQDCIPILSGSEIINGEKYRHED